MISNKELTNRFTCHPPVDNKIGTYEQIRKEGALFAGSIVNQTPECREQSIAVTKIEEAVFWANAAIARRS